MTDDTAHTHIAHTHTHANDSLGLPLGVLHRGAVHPLELRPVVRVHCNGKRNTEETGKQDNMRGQLVPRPCGHTNTNKGARFPFTPDAGISSQPRRKHQEIVSPNKKATDEGLPSSSS